MTTTPNRPKWRSGMTDRERFVAQMHHQAVDRCFNREFGYWADNYRQWPIFVDNGIGDEAQANAFFSFDAMPAVGGRVWMHPGFAYRGLERRGAVMVIQNSDGLTAEVPVDGHGTIPHFTGSSIAGPDDWRRVKEEHFQIDHPDRIIDFAALRQRHPDERDYPLGVNCGSMIGKVRDMLTIEGLSYAVADHPEMVEDMVETCCQLVERALDQLLPYFDFAFACGWEDISCNSGPLVSLAFFNDVVVPRYQRLGEKLRAHGVDIWFTDSDGDVRPLIPGFLSAGLNTMFPWEVNGSGHPGDALERWGPELRIMGGVDKMQLRRGREATRSYLESLVPYVEGGGFIPFCDHRCPPDVDQEVYLYYLDLKEDLFGMPADGCRRAITA